MTPPSDSGAAILRAAGEPCAVCGAALAADQRYCLECGARAGAPRLDPLLLARGDSPPPTAFVTPAAGAARPTWDSLPPAALALGRPRVAAIAAVGVLAFGALIGAGTAPAPPSSASGPVYLAGTSQPPADAAASGGAADGSAAPVDDTAGSSSTPLDPVEPVSPLPADDGAGDTAVTTPDDSGNDDSSTTPAADQPALKAPAPVKHVWLISLEGVDLVAAAQVAAAPASAAQAAPAPTGVSPKLAELVSSGTLLTGYESLTKGSLANSVALVSGLEPTPAQAANCTTYSAVSPGKVSAKTGLVSGDGCVEPAQAVTIADRLTGAGAVWRAYAEDIGAGPPDQTSCRHPEVGAVDATSVPRPGDAYLTWRDPFVYFGSITESADCGTSVVGLDRLAADLKSADDTPAFSYVIPSACHDGSVTPCGDGAPAELAGAVPWLSGVVDQIRASPAFEDGGLIVITSPDGLRPDDAPADKGVRVGALLLSQYVAAGSSVGGAYDHLSLLKTMSAFFGVEPPARAAGDAVRLLSEKVFANAPAAGEG